MGVDNGSKGRVQTVFCKNKIWNKSFHVAEFSASSIEYCTAISYISSKLLNNLYSQLIFCAFYILQNGNITGSSTFFIFSFKTKEVLQTSVVGNFLRDKVSMYPDMQY